MFGVVHRLRVDDALAAPDSGAGYSFRLPVVLQQDDLGGFGARTVPAMQALLDRRHVVVRIARCAEHFRARQVGSALVVGMAEANSGFTPVCCNRLARIWHAPQKFRQNHL
jgi:hypothetical protein